MGKEGRKGAQFWAEGQPLTDNDRLLLTPILVKAAELGYTPAKGEVPNAVHIKKRFRIWKDAVAAAGLPEHNDKVQMLLRASGPIQTELLQREIPVSEFVETCVDIPKYLGYCAKCGNYNKVWSCPAFSFLSESVWSAYDTLLLYGKKIYTPSAWVDMVLDGEELKQRYTQLLKPQKERMLSELLEMEKAIPGSMALSAGSCNLCGATACARQNGEPCRQPARMRYSIEALGGGVSEALELYWGAKLLWAEGGCLPPYFILLGGLLKRKEI